MQSTNWAPEHSQALREYLAKGMSYSEIARGHQREIQHRLFPQCHDRPRQADGACRLDPPGGRLAEAADAKPRTAASHKMRERYRGQIPAGRGRFSKRAAALQAALRRDRSAPSVAAGARSRRLPLSLWRRRGGRSHHLLRSPAPRGFKLLRAAFSSDARPWLGVGTRRRHGLAAAGGGGMTRMATPDRSVDDRQDEAVAAPSSHRASARADRARRRMVRSAGDELAALLRESGRRVPPTKTAPP